MSNFVLVFGFRVMPWETSLLYSQSYFGGPHFILCGIVRWPATSHFSFVEKVWPFGLGKGHPFGSFWSLNLVCAWEDNANSFGSLNILFLFPFLFLLGGGNHRWTRVENLQVGSLTILAYKDYAWMENHRDWRSSGNPQKCIPPPLSYIIINCSILYRGILF